MLEDFLSHLEELRRRLVICLLFFSLAAVVCYFFSHSIIDLLTRPLHRLENIQLFFQKPYEAFFVHLKVAALGGFLISSPVLFTQAWFFVAPGLYEKEKKIFLPLIVISVSLFLIGAFFAYQFVIPWGLYFLLSFQTETLKPLLGVGPYFSFLIGMILGFGILFDFPVILIGVVRLGLVRTSTLAQARRVVIVLIFIAAAVLTPSPDPISQILLALPLMILFEVSLIAARLVEKKKP